MKRESKQRCAVLKRIIVLLAAAIIAIPTLIVLCRDAHAEEWTSTDTNYEIAYQVVHAIDWGQTRYIATHNEYYETNPILGEHPSVGSVDAYFIVTGVAHYLIARELPHNYRRAWQIVFTIDHAQAAVNNYNIGIKMRF